MTTDQQVRNQLEKILRLRKQYRAAKAETQRLNRLAAPELQKLQKLLR